MENIIILLPDDIHNPKCACPVCFAHVRLLEGFDLMADLSYVCRSCKSPLSGPVRQPHVVQTLDVGNQVLCDFCNVDYTDSDEIGGVLLGSKAACPKCEPGIRQGAREHNEEHLLVYAPEGMMFRVWVLQLRGGDNTIRVVTW